MNGLKLYNDTVFDGIKHIDEYDNEYWLARELMPILQYSHWQNFEKIINNQLQPVKIAILMLLTILLMSIKW